MKGWANTAAGSASRLVRSRRTTAPQSQLEESEFDNSPKKILKRAVSFGGFLARTSTRTFEADGNFHDEPSQQSSSGAGAHRASKHKRHTKQISFEPVAWSDDERRKYLIVSGLVREPNMEKELWFVEAILDGVPLPAPWDMARHDHGRFMFVNTETGDTDDDHPFKSTLADILDTFRACRIVAPDIRDSFIATVSNKWKTELFTELSKWNQAHDDSGAPYYWNKESGATTWSTPLDVALPGQFLRTKAKELLLENPVLDVDSESSQPDAEGCGRVDEMHSSEADSSELHFTGGGSDHVSEQEPEPTARSTLQLGNAGESTSCGGGNSWEMQQSNDRPSFQPDLVDESAADTGGDKLKAQQSAGKTDSRQGHLDESVELPPSVERANPWRNTAFVSVATHALCHWMSERTTAAPEDVKTRVIGAFQEAQALLERDLFDEGLVMREAEAVLERRFAEVSESVAPDRKYSAQAARTDQTSEATRADQTSEANSTNLSDLPATLNALQTAVGAADARWEAVAKSNEGLRQELACTVNAMESMAERCIKVECAEAQAQVLTEASIARKRADEIWECRCELRDSRQANHNPVERRWNRPSSASLVQSSSAQRRPQSAGRVVASSSAGPLPLTRPKSACSACPVRSDSMRTLPTRVASAIRPFSAQAFRKCSNGTGGRLPVERANAGSASEVLKMHADSPFEVIGAENRAENVSSSEQKPVGNTEVPEISEQKPVGNTEVPEINEDIPTEIIGPSTQTQVSNGNPEVRAAPEVRGSTHAHPSAPQPSYLEQDADYNETICAARSLIRDLANCETVRISLQHRFHVAESEHANHADRARNLQRGLSSLKFAYSVAMKQASAADRKVLRIQHRYSDVSRSTVPASAFAPPLGEEDQRKDSRRQIRTEAVMEDLLGESGSRLRSAERAALATASECSELAAHRDREACRALEAECAEETARKRICSLETAIEHNESQMRRQFEMLLDFEAQLRLRRKRGPQVCENVRDAEDGSLPALDIFRAHAWFRHLPHLAQALGLKSDQSFPCAKQSPQPSESGAETIPNTIGQEVRKNLDASRRNSFDSRDSKGPDPSVCVSKERVRPLGQKLSADEPQSRRHSFDSRDSKGSSPSTCACKERVRPPVQKHSANEPRQSFLEFARLRKSGGYNFEPVLGMPDRKPDAYRQVNLRGVPKQMRSSPVQG